jgi:hypothetical protein
MPVRAQRDGDVGMAELAANAREVDPGGNQVSRCPTAPVANANAVEFGSAQHGEKSLGAELAAALSVD